MSVADLGIGGATDVGLIFKTLKPERRHLQQYENGRMLKSYATYFLRTEIGLKMRERDRERNYRCTRSITCSWSN